MDTNKVSEWKDTNDDMIIAQPSGTKPTLQTLPPEIRNEIFSLAIIYEEPLPAYPYGDLYVGARGQPDSFPLSAPPLARVCHQIREEALPIFSGCNTFVFYGLRLNMNISRDMGVIAWFKELDSLNQGISKQVRRIDLRSSRYYKASTIMFLCREDGGVTITAELDAEASNSHADPCVCTFNETVQSLLRHTDSQTASLGSMVEIFNRKFSWKLPYSSRRTRGCGDEYTCGKGRGRTTSVHVHADGRIE